MDKSQKKALKNQFKKEQEEKDSQRIKAAHPILYQMMTWQEESEDLLEITHESVQKWGDLELENKVSNIIYNKFSQARKMLKRQYTIQHELGILREQPEVVRAFFAISDFENDISLNQELWNYFYQNGAYFALEALEGYILMGNQSMKDLIWQGMGAYTKMLISGEIDELCGEKYHWNVDYEILMKENTKTFEELDRMVKALDFETLYDRRIRFFRENFKA